MARYINEAVVLDREALELCEPDHHLQPVCLVIAPLTHYNQFSIVIDIEEVIVLD